MNAEKITPPTTRGTDPGFLLAILLVLALAAALRFPDLASKPGWYTDEGTLIVAAEALNEGAWNYLGLSDSILIAGRPPLFVAALALAFRLFGTDIGTLRAMTAGLGLVTALSLILVPAGLMGKRGRAIGLLAGALYAGLPYTVLYNRLGFSYNLPAALMPWILYGSVRYWRSGEKPGLLLACGLAGIGFLGELWMAAVIPFCLLLALFRRRRDLLPALVAALLPGLVYIGLMFARYPETFGFDLAFTGSRLNFSLLFQVRLVLMNYALLVTGEPWVALGIAGLFLIPERTFRNVALACFGLVFLAVARSVILLGVGAYQFMPLAPLVVLGLAAFVYAAGSAMIRWAEEELAAVTALTLPSRRLLGAAAAAFLLGVPLLVVSLGQAEGIMSGPEAEISWLLVDPEDARAAAVFVNARVDPESVVIASPAAGWPIDAHVTDFQVSLAYEGYRTQHFPTNIPRARFTFDPRVTQARFVIVDRIWDNWALSNVPDMHVIMDEIDGWPLAATIGEFRIYENPGR